MNYSLLLILWVGLLIPSATLGKVKSFSPLGQQEEITQVRIEFPSAQVGFGDLNVKAPATSACFQTFPGQGRWLNTQEWVFDFNAVLPAGIECDIKVGAESFSFNTGEPNISIRSGYSAEITSDQHFIIQVPSSISDKKLASTSYVLIEGIGDRIPVEIISQEETKKIYEKIKRSYAPLEGYKIILAKAQRALPLGAKGNFIVSKGLEYRKGKNLTKDYSHEFQVRGAFEVSLSCDHHTTKQTNCMPLGSVYLSFNRDIDSEYAKDIYLLSPRGKKVFSNELESVDPKNKISKLVFEGPFDDLATYKVVAPAKVKSTEGETLTKFVQTFKTDKLPPLLKFDSGFGVYESDGKSAIPLNVRNVELSLPTSVYGVKERVDFSQLPKMLKFIRFPGAANNVPTDEDLKKIGVHSEQINIVRKKAAKAIEVVGVPVSQKGLYLIKVNSSTLNTYYADESSGDNGYSLYSSKNAAATEWTMALVTNLAAHVKESHEEFVVWVTQLKTAKPVAAAEVQIYNEDGKLYATAKTDNQGFAVIKKSSLPSEIKNNLNERSSGIFVVAQSSDDFTLTSNYWENGFEPWRFGASSYNPANGSILHAILDRTLLKENETLSGKMISRYFNDKGLLISEKNEYPTILNMNHNSGLQKFEIPLQWNKQNGTAIFSWKIPNGVKNGLWELAVGDEVITTVIVEDYRLPMIDLKVAADKPHYIAPKNIPINVYGQYFSGGVASDLKFKFRWSLEQDYEDLEGDYGSYTFFTTLENTHERYEEESVESEESTVNGSVVEGTLDKNGKWTRSLPVKMKGARPYRLNSEVEYRDPNGEIKIAKKYIKIWPEDTVIGVKDGTYKLVGDKYQLDVDVVVIDPDGKPLVNRKVDLKLVKAFSYTHKKRLLGGFYGSDYYLEYKDKGKLCSGKTNASGKFSCQVNVNETGEIFLVAETKSGSGKMVSSAVSMWLPSKKAFYLGDYSNSDRIDLIPTKKSYKVGEVAELKLAMPFNEAQVWITVEREGLLHRELKVLKANNPVIKIPIKPEYSPNVFITALAVRGRVSEFKKDQTVDLGRPSMKFAMTNLTVEKEHHLLKVNVTTPKKDYKARELVKVKVKVTDFKNRPTPQAEVLLVGVDEGLLALKGNNTWDLTNHLLKSWGLRVSTATNMVQLEGKRHFGLKAVPAGGDGSGGVLTRELFDSLLYWHPNLKVDQNGEVEVAVKLNDSTTSFRFVAVVLNGHDQFGTGKTSVRSSQDFIVMPGVANVARSGDRFDAGFTLRNTTAKEAKVHLTLTTDLKGQQHKPQILVLKPQEAQEVFWSVQIPEGLSRVTYILEAKNEKGQLVDRVKKTQTVVPFAQPRIYQASFGPLSQTKNLQVLQPENLDKKTSEINVDLMANLGASDKGLKTFWEAYGYTCFEQQFSKAITLVDLSLWKKLSTNLSVYLDSEGLVKYFPKSEKGDLALTAYVLSMTQYRGWSIPEEFKERMTAGLGNFIEGRLPYRGLYPDDTLLKISAIEALALNDVSNPAWIPNLKVNLDVLPMYSLLQLSEIAKQNKSLLGPSVDVKVLVNKIRAHFYFTGTKIYLKNNEQENLFWLLRDENTTLLKFMQTYMHDPEFLQDIPKVFRAVLERQTNNSFPLTMNNAWLSVVNDRFQKLHSTPITGQTEVKMGSALKTHHWQSGGKASLSFLLNKKSEVLTLEQKGTGNPWVSLSAKGVLIQNKDEFNGFVLKRNLRPIIQKTKGQWSVGDRVQVEIEFSSKFQSNWVVVSEPTPTGASLLEVNSSAIHEYKPEVSNFYFPWVYSGHKLTYTLLFNQKGEYKLPGTLVEVMYSPDIYAKLADTVVVVK